MVHGQIVHVEIATDKMPRTKGLDPLKYFIDTYCLLVNV